MRRLANSILQFILLALFVSLKSCSSESSDTSDEQPNVSGDFGVFVDVTVQAGLKFNHEAGAEGKYYMPEQVGPGSAFFDYDGDGDLDIYLINGGWVYQTEREAKNRMYRQDEGGKFVDVTDESGLGDMGYGMGVAIGDVDNDGDEDVYVTNFGDDAFYRNNGDGTFSNRTKESGLASNVPDRWGCSATFLDYDLDGFLDLYVANYVEYDSSLVCTDQAGRRLFCSPQHFVGAVDALYKNNGDGTFRDVSRAGGIEVAAKRGLGVVTADVNDDGYPDIYVANDLNDNLLWINQKNGTFREEGLKQGVALNQLGQAEAGMGIAVGDVNGDLRTDFLVTHLGNESNTLYLNTPASGFQDRSFEAGFEDLRTMQFTGFGTGLADLDLDGFLDLVVGNGRVDRVGAPLRQDDDFWAIYAEPNFIFKGEGKGRFTNISSSMSVFGGAVENTRGMSFADFDNDGDVDILVNNCGGPAQLFRNDMKRNGAWITITPFDPALNRIVEGAKITVKTGGKSWRQESRRAYSYLCSNDPRVHFGLGKVDKIDEVIIEWPGGENENFEIAQLKKHYILNRGSDSN